jgi:ribosomal protein S18 acetylase RimI-like enzyme
MTTVRHLRYDERDWAAGFYGEPWGGTRMARLGELLDLRDLPAFVAEHEGEVAAVATYAIRGERCELAGLTTSMRRVGAGTALVDAVTAEARQAGCSTLWVLTTNDNTPALRFYQRAGFDLVALHRGAVDEARRELKPEIPEVGRDGIPLRHELVLELAL